MNSREWLERLWADGQMPIRRAPQFDRVPHGTVPNWNRVEGMLLGLAIGDALGNTSEGLSTQQRSELVGEVRDYRPTPLARSHPRMASSRQEAASWHCDRRPWTCWPRRRFLRRTGSTTSA
jgi:ADP-ribosyl-[dinitrogen reductase] hydrolase